MQQLGSVAKIPLMFERAPKIFSEIFDERLGCCHVVFGLTVEW
jgi:hypothetical protein